MTGWVSLSIRMFIDMIWMPVADWAGIRTPPSPFGSEPSTPTSALVTPNMRGMLGPVMSQSMMAVRYPWLRLHSAQSPVTEDFPTPPLPLTMPIIFFTWLPSFAGT